MAKHIEAGATFVANGTVTATETLIGDAGNATTPTGATVLITTTSINNGTIVLAAGPSVPGESGGAGATGRNTGVLTNRGVLTLQGGAYGSPSGGGPVRGAQFVNDGTMKNTGTVTVGAAASGGTGTAAGTGAVLRTNGSLVNNAKLAVYGATGGYSAGSGGTVVVAGMLANNGSLAVGGASGGGAAGGGVIKVLAPGTLSNAGQLTLAGGDAAAGGTLNVLGALNNSGMIGVGSGAYAGGALLNISATGTLNNTGRLGLAGGDGPAAPGLAGGGLLTDAGVLVNSGTLMMLGGLAGAASHGYGSTLMVTGTLASISYLDIEGGAGASTGSTTGLGATLQVNGVLTSSGNVVVQAGYLGRDGADGGAGVLLDNRSFNNSGYIKVNGGTGGIDGTSSPGGTLDVAGSLTNSGYIRVYPGLQGSAGSHGTGGTLLVTGVLTNVHGGIILVAGQTPVPYPSGTAGQMFDDGVIDNKGQIYLGLGYATGAQGTLTVEAGATLMNAGTINGGGILLNNGVVGSGGNGRPGGGKAIINSVGISATLINNAVVNVAPSNTLVVDSAVYSDQGGGLFDLTAHGTLTLNGAVSADQTVQLQGNGAVLALGAAGSFLGVIQNLHATTAIDFLGRDVISATEDGSTLTVGLDTGQSLYYALLAPAAGLTLQLSSDGKGGTDVTAVGGAALAAGSDGAMAMPHAGLAAPMLTLSSI